MKKYAAGKTGHAETVKVVFDPEELSLPFLLKTVLLIIDPVSVNKQGNDRDPILHGHLVYYADEGQTCYRNVPEKAPAALQAAWQLKFSPSANFHGGKISSRYLDKNHGGYCHIPPPFGSVPGPAKTNLFTGKNRTKSCAAS